MTRNRARKCYSRKEIGFAFPSVTPRSLRIEIVYDTGVGHRLVIEKMKDVGASMVRIVPSSVPIAILALFVTTIPASVAGTARVKRNPAQEQRDWAVWGGNYGEQPLFCFDADQPE